MASDPIVTALCSASPKEARAALEALAAFVENELADGDGDGNVSPHLEAAESLLERLNVALVGE